MDREKTAFMSLNGLRIPANVLNCKAAATSQRLMQTASIGLFSTRIIHLDGSFVFIGDK